MTSRSPVTLLGDRGTPHRHRYRRTSVVNLESVVLYKIMPMTLCCSLMTWVTGHKSWRPWIQMLRQWVCIRHGPRLVSKMPAMEWHHTLWSSMDTPSTLLAALHTWAVSSAHAVVPRQRWRIGLASSVMGQLTSVWRKSRLSLRTKLRLYNALVVSVLLYSAETWTLTKSDKQKLKSFQMSCLRRILGICWFDFVPNVSVMNQTQQQSIHNRIRDRRISVFGHVRRLQESVPEHKAPRLVVNSRAGHRPDDRPAWKRPWGRPRQWSWIRQLEIDVGLTADAAWDMAGDHDIRKA